MTRHRPGHRAGPARAESPLVAALNSPLAPAHRWCGPWTPVRVHRVRDVYQTDASISASGISVTGVRDHVDRGDAGEVRSPLVAVLNGEIARLHMWCTPTLLEAQSRVADPYRSDVHALPGPWPPTPTQRGGS